MHTLWQYLFILLISVSSIFKNLYCEFISHLFTQAPSLFSMLFILKELHPFIHTLSSPKFLSEPSELGQLGEHTYFVALPSIFVSENGDNSLYKQSE